MTKPSDRFLTRIFDPGPVTRACDVAVHRLYRYAEVAAGFDPEALDGTEDRSAWPLPQGAQPAPRRDVPDWGAYGPAIARHEAALGRPAPNPVDDRGRLNPVFVEWMQMTSAGWVTDIVTNRAKALKVLGNGVVPAQAAYALRSLLNRP